MYSWLSQLGAFYKSDGVPHTHTRMSGGNLFISENDYEEFQYKYSQMFDNGDRTMTYSEKRTDPVFKMYFDIDLLDENVLDESYMINIVKIIQSVVSRFFSDESNDKLKCVISTTQPKKVIVDKVPKPESEEEVSFNEYTKNGLHITYPLLNVDIQMALQLRFSVVSELEVQLGQRPIKENPWSDVLDKSPYYNGLKMCGSVKITPCPCSKSSGKPDGELADIIEKIKVYRSLHYPRKGHYDYKSTSNLSKDEFKNETISEMITKFNDISSCNLCNGDKRIHENRFYMPLYVCDFRGENIESDTVQCKSSTFESVKWTCIRCKQDEVVSQYSIPKGTAMAPIEVRGSNFAKIEKKLIKLSPGIYRESVNSDIFASDMEGIQSWTGVEIVDPEILSLIKVEIRKMDLKYKDISIKNVFQVNNVEGKRSSKKNNNGKILTVRNTYTIRVMGDGSTYCRNKMNTHKSNTCYFTIGEKSGLKQKCFSKKDTVWGGGRVPCSQFESERVEICSRLKELLFPVSCSMISSESAFIRGLNSSKSLNKNLYKTKKVHSLDESKEKKLAKKKKSMSTILLCNEICGTPL